MLDLTTADAGTGRISIILGNGDGTFNAAGSFSAGSDIREAAVADVNNDGVLDIISADGTDHRVSIFLGNGVRQDVAPLAPLSNISVATRASALAAQENIDAYMNQVTTVSGSIGVNLSRLTIAAANLQTGVEATTAALSRITDADIAEESAHLVSANILQRAASAVLAQANQQPRLALTLLSVTPS